MRKILMSVAGLAMLTAASASPAAAQSRTVTGAAIGAGSGLLIAGPVGAVVGGFAGAAIGGPRISGPRRYRGNRNYTRASSRCWTNEYGQRVCRR